MQKNNIRFKNLKIEIKYREQKKGKLHKTAEAQCIGKGL